MKVGQGALCGLSNVLFIKSRAWVHVQFAMAGVVQEACVTLVLDVTGNLTQWAGRGTSVLAMPAQNWGVPLVPLGSVKMNLPLQASKMSRDPCLEGGKTRG